MIDGPPLLSVIVPAWNREETIVRAVESLRSQTLTNFEVVVVDNGSTDATISRVRSMSDERLRIVSLPENVGPSAARNAGAALARGTYLGFLDSDDEVEPEWAASLVATFDDPRFAVACCGYHSTRGGDVLPADLGRAFGPFVGRFQAGAFILRRDVFELVGGYVDRLWYGENTEFALRVTAWCVENNRDIASIPRVLMRWHQGPLGRYDDALDRRMESALYTAEHHRAQLARDPVLLASHYAIAGRCSYRLGDFRGATNHYRTAVACTPKNKHYRAWMVASGLRSLAPVKIRKRKM